MATLAGSLSGSADGIGTSATFNRPEGIVVCSSQIYVADFLNYVIRSITSSGLMHSMDMDIISINYGYYNHKLWILLA